MNAQIMYDAVTPVTPLHLAPITNPGDTGTHMIPANGAS